MFGCDNSKSPSNSVNDNINIDSVHWVGSDVIFNDIEGKKEYSIIFFFTEWCGYCHKMDQITFSDSNVYDILNGSFNCARVDAESDTLLVHFDSTATGRQLKTFYDIGYYPTICVFRDNGEYLTKGIGYTNPVDFEIVLNKILNGDFE